MPEELLYSLTLRSDNLAPETRDRASETTPAAASESTADGISKSTTCTLCDVVSQNVQDQRTHVRSDFHRYNLKLRLRGVKPVDEATFIKLVGDLDESISGSDTSSSGSEDEKGGHQADTTLKALLRKQARISGEEQNGETPRPGPGLGKQPLLWMSSSILGNDTALGIYRALFSEVEQEEAALHLIDIVKKKQLKPAHAKPNRATNGPHEGQSTSPHVFLCMIGGGHFAAMIVSLAPEIRKGPGGIEERHAVVQAHKTFHRYTTRRKQGGSQSANDNAKGNAHSAGSSIRRYNEAALEADVRNVLLEWKGMIDNAELLFIRATGSTNRRTLFGPYDGQVLRSNDKRLRGFPFSTRRATQTELLRAFQELTRLKVSNVTESAIEKSATSQPSTTPSKIEKTKPESPTKPTPEEEAAILHTTQLMSLIRRTKAPAMLLYLSKNQLDPNYRFFPLSDHHHAPTPIHLASSTNSPALVTSLLLKAGADPTQQNDHGKTAYEVAGNARTRDAFRVARHQLGEAKWDWAAARVPAGMSQDEADERLRKEKEDEERTEIERRKNDLDQIRREDEERKIKGFERKGGGGRTVAVAEKTGAERREEESRGMSEEMRKRLERERRARAAEERMKNLQR